MHEDIRWYYVNSTHFLILPQNHKNATLKRRPRKTQPLNVAHPSPDKPGFSRKVWLARATPPVGGGGSPGNSRFAWREGPPPLRIRHGQGSPRHTGINGGGGPRQANPALPGESYPPRGGVALAATFYRGHHFDSWQDWSLNQFMTAIYPSDLPVIQTLIFEVSKKTVEGILLLSGLKGALADVIIRGKNMQD